MRIRLTRRLADLLDGVDVSTHRVGDTFEVTRQDGALLIAEGWAVQMAPRFQIAEQLRDIRAQIHRRSFPPHDHRRAEDQIRDQWHEAHARILNGRDTSR